MAAAPAPTGIRLDRLSSKVVWSSVDKTKYPANVNTVSLSLHDLAYFQALLSNNLNFAEKGLCHIFTFSAQAGTGRWEENIDCFGLSRILASPLGSSGPPSEGLTRVFFCTLERQEKSNFGHRISLSSSGTRELLETLHVNPHFLPLLLGQPDYWAPLNAQSRHPVTGSTTFEYICQHPRWNTHSRLEPCSVYMSYDSASNNTNYIVASDAKEGFINRVKSRLNANFDGGQMVKTSTVNHQDGNPFLLHAMIAHESFKESKSVITSLRYRLYDQLDAVKYYENTADRVKLRQLTGELHGISQDADSLLASADMAIMVANGMRAALERKVRVTAHNTDDSEISDTINYLKESLASQQRWLVSYKSRKDIAMNLVFNLVTQRDSETNTAIARDTKDDSANMKIIAVLTMLFLPATAVASVFGMAVFTWSDRDDRMHTASEWWLFPAITIPLTLLTFVLWWLWYPLQFWFARLSQDRGRPLKNLQRVTLEPMP